MERARVANNYLKINLQDLAIHLAALCTFSGNFLSTCSFELLWQAFSERLYSKNSMSKTRKALESCLSSVVDIYPVPLWKLDFTMDTFWNTSTGLIGFTCHIFTVLGRAVHRQLSKCIWEVLQLLWEGLKKQAHSTESVFNKFSKFMGKHSAMESFSSKTAASNFLKKKSITGILLWLLQNFSTKLFPRAPVNDCIDFN